MKHLTGGLLLRGPDVSDDAVSITTGTTVQMILCSELASGRGGSFVMAEAFTGRANAVRGIREQV